MSPVWCKVRFAWLSQSCQRRGGDDSADRKALDHILAWLLGLSGAMTLTALGAVVMPYDWMNVSHHRLGMGELPHIPIVGYLGDSDCWVIDGATARGQYTLWIDPRHSRKLAKAEVRRKQGDRDRDDVLPKDASEQASVLNVRVEQHAGSWVLTESDAAFETRNPGGWFRSNTRHRITDISLQPDHPPPDGSGPSRLDHPRLGRERWVFILLRNPAACGTARST